VNDAFKLLYSPLLFLEIVLQIAVLLPGRISGQLHRLALLPEVFGLAHPVSALAALIVVVGQGDHILLLLLGLLEERVRSLLHEPRVEVSRHVRRSVP